MISSDSTHLVLFALDDQRYAVALDRVEQVVPRPEIAVFPKAPEIVCGVFVLRGELIPVVNVRARFRLPPAPAKLSDQLLIVRTPRRRLALIVDRVDGVEVITLATIKPPADVVPGLEYVQGIVRLEAGGIIFVHDLDTFLSLDEEETLEAATARIP